MKVLALSITAFLLLFAPVLLTGCAPMPYQGPYDSYTEIIIIHDPWPPPCPPPGPEYPRPRPPAPDRNVPLTKDRVTGDNQPRTKEPVQGRPPRRPVTKPSRYRGEPDPVRVAEQTSGRSPRTR